MRIRAGGDQRWSSLPRPPTDELTIASRITPHAALCPNAFAISMESRRANTRLTNGGDSLASASAACFCARGKLPKRFIVAIALLEVSGNSNAQFGPEEGAAAISAIVPLLGRGAGSRAPWYCWGQASK